MASTRAFRRAAHAHLRDIRRGRPQTVYANAYTDYVLDRIADPDEGIFVMVPVPYLDPDESANLIDRVRNERGVAGVCFVSQGGPEQPLGKRRYDPIYEAGPLGGLTIITHWATTSLDGFLRRGLLLAPRDPDARFRLGQHGPAREHRRPGQAG